VPSTRHNVGDLNITINDDSINVDNDVKYLGVYVSNDLSWDKHISNVCRKLGHGLQILRRLQGIVPVNDMVTIYKTIIQPHIDYCITIWGYAPKCQLKRVQRLQNKIFRLITDDYSWDTSPRDILSKFNIPSISQRRDYFNGINVFRCLNGSFPTYMSDMLSCAGDVNTYVTRHTVSNDLYVPRPRVEIYRQSFQYTGPTSYNNIPQDVKDSQSLSTFKISLKSHIMS
jgi:hypothetical protein